MDAEEEGVQRGNERRTGGAGWSDPKRRRICYALFAMAIGVVGVAPIANSATKEKEYNTASKDDDFF